ncbi:MAG: type II toxin-antitoxin system MqsR family toxin [Burkholderiaceae bacterium]|nr:type II toxin-antitoxin system MqsR family toxin [Burkholderiaceae bacterium]MEB2351270.1 type II toxin-antitoxin system MqsR family toxin [Burkholderiaceae bacterium]
MEKSRPHYRLDQMQVEIARLGAAAFTKTAIDGGRAMGLTMAEMLAVIAGLTRRDFYKSMTTHADHHVWQDVYHAATPAGCVAYIKLTQVNDRPVVQFKER